MWTWQHNLEIAGADFFQRYRKRLMNPGITFDIWRDHPGWSLLDILVRVNAARRLLRDGHEFIALQTIRDGRWQPVAGRSRPPAEGGCDGGHDRVSPILVVFGACLFASFFMLSMWFAVSASAPGMLALGMLSAVGCGWGLQRLRRRLASASLTFVGWSGKGADAEPHRGSAAAS